MPAGMDFDLETLLDDSLKILSQNVDTVSKASKMLVIIRKVTAKSIYFLFENNAYNFGHHI